MTYKYESEKSVETRLVNKIKKMGGWCIKLSAIHISGIPDRLCIIPMGRAIFVELKASNKKPRPIQSYVHKQLLKIGFRVRIIDSKLGVDEFIESLK
jgi:hypothetical protein